MTRSNNYNSPYAYLRKGKILSEDNTPREVAIFVVSGRGIYSLISDPDRESYQKVNLGYLATHGVRFDKSSENKTGITDENAKKLVFDLADFLESREYNSLSTEIKRKLSDVEAFI